jgi:hypothetical protein
MALDPEQRAQLKLDGDPLTAPRDWSDAVEYPTLTQALEAAVDRMADTPWIRSGEQTLSPAQIDDLWKELFRSRSD